MFAMHLNHISQHLDLEFLWGEVLHIQVDRESVLLQTHLEIARWGRGKRKGRNVNDTSTISSLQICSLSRWFILLFLAKNSFLNKHALWLRGITIVVPQAHHVVVRLKLYLQGQGRRQATQGTKYKDGSRRALCCFSKPMPGLVVCL